MKIEKKDPMAKIWDVLGAIIITAVVVKMVLDFIAPYAPFLVAGIIIVLVGRAIYDRRSNW